MTDDTLKTHASTLAFRVAGHAVRIQLEAEVIVNKLKDDSSIVTGVEIESLRKLLNELSDSYMLTYNVSERILTVGL